MPKPLKPHKAITIKMDSEIHDLLVAYCEVAGQSKTTAIERAVKAYVEAYEKKEGVRLNENK